MCWGSIVQISRSFCQTHIFQQLWKNISKGIAKDIECKALRTAGLESGVMWNGGRHGL
jgi:hypothetical protein